MSTYTVRILDQDVFTLGLLHDQVGNRSHDTPTIVERDVHLSSKLQRLVRLHTDNDVSLGISRVGSGNVTAQ